MRRRLMCHHHIGHRHKPWNRARQPLTARLAAQAALVDEAGAVGPLAPARSKRRRQVAPSGRVAALADANPNEARPEDDRATEPDLSSSTSAMTAYAADAVASAAPASPSSGADDGPVSAVEQPVPSTAKPSSATTPAHATDAGGRGATAAGASQGALERKWKLALEQRELGALGDARAARSARPASDAATATPTLVPASPREATGASIVAAALPALSANDARAVAAQAHGSAVSTPVSAAAAASETAAVASPTADAAATNAAVKATAIRELRKPGKRTLRIATGGLDRQCVRLILAPCAGDDAILEALTGLRGGVSAKRSVIRELIEEAMRFRKRDLAARLEDYDAQLQDSSG